MANVQLDSVTLNRIAGIFDLEHETDRLTGKKFNAFDLAGVEYDEVRICRVLSNLLDPKGSHCQGGFFLEKFCRKVLNLDPKQLPEKELKRAKVIREYSIHKTKRRIDLVIITSDHFKIELNM